MDDFIATDIFGFTEPEEIEMTDVAKVPAWLGLVLGIISVRLLRYRRTPHQAVCDDNDVVYANKLYSLTTQMRN